MIQTKETYFFRSVTELKIQGYTIARLALTLKSLFPMSILASYLEICKNNKLCDNKGVSGIVFFNPG